MLHIVFGAMAEVDNEKLKYLMDTAEDEIIDLDEYIHFREDLVKGTFETLHGCGLNIYYLFLCKCDWFVRRFNLEKFKGVFINEKNLYI